MNQLCSLAELNDNLVPFTARRITSSLIWCAENVRNTEVLLKACSYIIDPVSSASAKTFHAERYGGSGIQRNGGGARCGFDGNYQVKGMGANPLVGVGTDGRHSNGALGAIHAIYEEGEVPPGQPSMPRWAFFPASPAPPFASFVTAVCTRPLSHSDRHK